MDRRNGRQLDVSLILLFDRQRRLLMQHRTSDAWIMPDHWAFFGGAIEASETPEDAVRREALEELGHVLQSPRLVQRLPYRHDDLWGSIYVFAEAFLGDKSRLELHEGQGWGWYDLSETEGLLMIERDRGIAAAVAAAVCEWGAPDGEGGR